MPRKKITPKEISEVSTGVRLSSHEKLCAERMKQIQEAIKELKTEVKALRTDVSMGKGGLKTIFYVGAVITAIIGFLKLLKIS